MDILNQIVEKLTKDELRFFKFYLGAIPGDDRKDLMLIDYVRQSGSKFDEGKIIRKLQYNEKDKNSYYRLKNRLIQDIGDSLTLLHTHKNELYELQHSLTLYHIYHSKALFKPCFIYLKKAERLAGAIESYELLDIVYSHLIRLSADLIEINPDSYISLRQENERLVLQLRKLDDVLATITHRLKFSQNFGQADKKALKNLQVKVKSISKQTTSHYSKNLQTRIYKALSQILLQQHNYPALEKFVMENLQRFEKENWFDQENHELKLQMLTYCANALYKNSKHKESLDYTVRLGSAIEEHKRLYYDRFLFFYYNLQILNHAVINPVRALKVLDEYEQLMRRKKNYYYDVFIYLNRSGLLYDLGRFNEALKSLVKLYVSDNYRKADDVFKFKVELTELIITFEARDSETLVYRIEQVKKTYKKFSADSNYKFDFSLLKLLELMAASKNINRDEVIQKLIRTLLRVKPMISSEDAEIIHYRDWLEKNLRR